MSYFHTREGLFFKVMPYGDVEFVATADKHLPAADKSNVIFEVTLGRGTIASLMASSCARGYTNETFFEAYAFLQAQKAAS